MGEGLLRARRVLLGKELIAVCEKAIGSLCQFDEESGSLD
jgi:hypothetical protein